MSSAWRHYSMRAHLRSFWLRSSFKKGTLGHWPIARLWPTSQHSSYAVSHLLLHCPPCAEKPTSLWLSWSWWAVFAHGNGAYGLWSSLPILHPIQGLPWRLSPCTNGLFQLSHTSYPIPHLKASNHPQYHFWSTPWQARTFPMPHLGRSCTTPLCGHNCANYPLMSGTLHSSTCMCLWPTKTISMLTSSKWSTRISWQAQIGRVHHYTHSFH